MLKDLAKSDWPLVGEEFFVDVKTVLAFLETRSLYAINTFACILGKSGHGMSVDTETLKQTKESI